MSGPNRLSSAWLVQVNNTGNTIRDTEWCGILFQFGAMPAGSALAGRDKERHADE